MSFVEFAESLSREKHPPTELNAALRALWLDRNGAWDLAHTAAQEDHSRGGAWVHAYLHRKEGDTGNADYWYAKAGRSRPAADVTLAQEWEAITRELLGK